ncbi:MAG: transglutaminase-like domain-containing protein, partial [Candidatus Aenigmatarchaeota archaeon]
MENKKIVLFLIIFLLILFSNTVSASEKEILKNPANVDELYVKITLYGKVIFDGHGKKIVINLSIPYEDESQTLEMNVKKVVEKNGNVFGVIETENPNNEFEYFLEGFVRVRARHLYFLPSQYTIPEEVKIYMQPTNNIQSNNPRIRSLAEEITKDAKNDFEKVVKLATWVHEHLTYDLSYTGKNLDALSVLEQKRGVCAEYTTLFIALVRSIGIPAKFVSGFSFGERGWERHAYAEVYLGKWVPVDPLWLEIGFLDATHIKFGESFDNYIKNNVEVTGFDINHIEWVEDKVNISIISYEMLEKVDYNLTISSDEFRRDYEGLVMLYIMPKEFIVGKIILEPCSGEYKIVDVEEKEKKVILIPNLKQQIYWKIKINEDLPKNYIFTCPLTLNSRSLALKYVNATVNTALPPKKYKKLNAYLVYSSVELGNEQRVYIKIENVDRPIKIGIVSEDKSEEWEIEKDFQTYFSLPPKTQGEKEIVVYTSEGEVIILKYNVTSNLSIEIENFTAPEYMKIGETKNISASIVNKGLGEENVRVNLNVDGVENIANLLLKDKYLISLPINFSTSGTKTIMLSVYSSRINISQTKIIEVFEEPLVKYETSYENGKAKLKVNVTKSKIKDVVIKIENVELKEDEIFGEKSFVFDLPEGG